MVVGGGGWEVYVGGRRKKNDHDGDEFSDWKGDAVLDE